MKKIQMVELFEQYLRLKDEIDPAIQEVINTSSFIKGKAVKSFQEELGNYLNIENVVGCANGTDALQLALMALDLKPGDEVITTPFTFISTVEVISLLQLKPVLVDVDPNTFNIDAANIESALTNKTRVILPVHLFGQSADMESILNIAEKHHLFVVEDNAQALGAEYTFQNGLIKKTGTMGTFGCTSFFPSKNLGAFGDGGAICTPDAKLAAKIQAMANHGMVKKYHYEHVGINSRLDTLQSAILRVKLQYLDEFNTARKNVANAYDQAFSQIHGLQIPARVSYSDHIFHQYTLQIKDNARDGLKNYLSNHNIPSMVYYPTPLHLQNAYKNLNYNPGDFPVTESLCNNVLSLPMHTEMTDEQLDYIISNVKQFFSQTHEN